MESKAETNRAIAIARVAWLATFVVPLVLAGLLLAVKTAHAAPAGNAIVPLAFEEELEGEEGEGELDEAACEVAEEGLEEGEFEAVEVEDICEEAEGGGKGKAAASGSVAPEECLVRSTHARVVVYASHNVVRLTLGYTTYEPTAATLDYRLVGGRGSLSMGTAKRQLGRSGVLRLSKGLSDSQMSKVEAAAHFTVRLHGAQAPGSCRPFETERLTVQHASKRLAVWSQAD
jgi:hypothetical protein